MIPEMWIYIRRIFLLIVKFSLLLILTVSYTEAKETQELDMASEEIEQQMHNPEVEAYEAFGAHLFPYEPIYFLYGNEPVDLVKFQVSLAVRLIPTTRNQERFDGFYFAYTQRSFWDLDSNSQPFFDSSYMPEFAYRYEGFNNSPPWGMEYQSYQAGFKHESNGQDGSDSRFMDIWYFQASWLWNIVSDWHLTIRPRVWTYAGKDFYNQDIDQYRGNFCLDANIGSRNGIYFATRTHVGSDFDKGSFELNVTYPLDELIHVPLYLHLQYFNGYAETLRAYNEHTDHFYIGFSAFR